MIQRFTNEDHLAVHKHKHEMTLKFGPARTDSVIIAGLFTCENKNVFPSSSLKKKSQQSYLAYFNISVFKLCLLSALLCLEMIKKKHFDKH